MSPYDTRYSQVSEKRPIVYFDASYQKKFSTPKTVKVFFTLTGNADVGSYVDYAFVLTNKNMSIRCDERRHLDLL